MHGIELLLANCDRLTRLTDMNYFEGVTPEEIEKLQAQYIYLDSKLLAPVVYIADLV